MWISSALPSLVESFFFVNFHFRACIIHPTAQPVFKPLSHVNSLFSKFLYTHIGKRSADKFIREAKYNKQVNYSSAYRLSCYSFTLGARSPEKRGCRVQWGRGSVSDAGEPRRLSIFFFLLMQQRWSVWKADHRSLFSWQSARELPLNSSPAGYHTHIRFIFLYIHCRVL